MPDNFLFSDVIKKFMNMEIKNLLETYTKRTGKKVEEVLFVPYAYDRPADVFINYFNNVKLFYTGLGVNLKNILEYTNPLEAIFNAQALCVGGGSFYKLVNTFSNEMMDIVNQKITFGMPYIGWNEGSVIACPTYVGNYNENDIFINAVPFQTFHHYVNNDSINQSIMEFLVDENYIDPDLRAPVKHVVCFMDSDPSKEAEEGGSAVRVEDENAGLSGFESTAQVVIYQLIDGEMQAVSYDPNSIPIL